MADGSQRHPAANAMDLACAEQDESMGLASIMTISNGAIVQGKKFHNKGKGRKGAVKGTSSQCI